MNGQEAISRLTQKQELFARELAEGRRSSDAYRVAYDADRMTAPTVWAEASRMSRHPKVAARVDALIEEKEAIRRMLSLQHADAILARLEHEALTARSDNARLKALELIGRHLGMFTDKLEVTQVETAAEIEARIAEKLDRLMG